MNTASNLRSTPRLERRASDYWQININNDELITRNIINVSPEGLAFKAPNRAQFQPGQTLHLQFNLGSDKVFECDARIAWAKDQQFGLKLIKVPHVFDVFVMKAIQDMAIESRRWEHDGTEEYPASVLRVSYRKFERSRILASALGLFMVAAMTAALVVAISVHQQNHPESWLANVLSTSFSKIISTGPGK